MDEDLDQSKNEALKRANQGVVALASSFCSLIAIPGAEAFSWHDMTYLMWLISGILAVVSIVVSRKLMGTNSNKIGMTGMILSITSLFILSVIVLSLLTSPRVLSS